MKNLFKLMLVLVCAFANNKVKGVECAKGSEIAVSFVSQSTIRIDITIRGIPPPTFQLLLTVCTNSTFTSGCIISSTAIGSSYTITGLSPNTIYYIKVVMTGCREFLTSGKTTSCTCDGSKPAAPTVTSANCKAVPASWTLNPCAKYYIVEFGKVGVAGYASSYNVGLNTSYTLLTSPTTYSFPSGSYKCRIRYLYRDCSTNTDKWSAYSDETFFSIDNSAVSAGASKSVPSCSTSVVLAATAVAGGYWTIVSPTPAGCTGTFSPNIYAYNATFTPNGACSPLTLKWQNGCGSDTMTVTVSSVCGTASSPNSITDSRDGKSYSTMLYNIPSGAKCWFTQNLNYGTQQNWYGTNNGSTQEPSFPATNGGTIYKYCFQNNSTNCSNYGGLYLGDYANVNNVCPCGWHSATDAEWSALAAYAGGGSALFRNTSPYYFNAIPSGVDGWLVTDYIYERFGHGNYYGSTPGYCLNNSSSYYGCWDNHVSGKLSRFWTNGNTGCPTCETNNGSGVSGNGFPSKYGYTASGYNWDRLFIEGSTSLILRNPNWKRYYANHIRCVKN